MDSSYVKYLHFLYKNSFEGFGKIVRMLIEKGAEINAVNINKNSALILAALKGNTSNAPYMCIFLKNRL